ncbi:hypothetical protein FRB99_006554 [Tulasnella sp. 403]|nr:hypothetical protein FRB99_006554 [Tulasnella sp. 403]
MLTRDYIHDSLYNPHYGYFSKNAVIYEGDEVAFGGLRDMVEFEAVVGRKYVEVGGEGGEGVSGPGRQVWHTPTELFKPWYGKAIAECLVGSYMLHHFPYEDLTIYELGAGNGTLALNILDHIRETYPEVYDRTRYRIIEISAGLARAQTQRLTSHQACVRVHNTSVFDWDTFVPAPCFFLALEVIDNFPHDMIRYDLSSLRPYQALIAVDADGDYSELYEPLTDPLIHQFLALRSEAHHPSPTLSNPLLKHSILRTLYRSTPFAPNLSPKPEFVPTRLLSFLKILRQHFPLHRLLLSDFSHLPDALGGYGAPVVQTGYRGTMVPVETLMVQPGYFDIFFPTDFALLRDLYEVVMSKSLRELRLPGDRPARTNADDRPSPLASTATSMRLGSSFFTPQGRRAPRDGHHSSTGLPVGERMSSIYTHQEFMQQYANLAGTRLRNGENPLLEYYRNVKFLF